MTNTELAAELKIAADMIAEARPLSGVSLLVSRASDALTIGNADGIASAGRMMWYVNSLLDESCSSVEGCEAATQLAVDAFGAVFGAV